MTTPTALPEPATPHVVTTTLCTCHPDALWHESSCPDVVAAVAGLEPLRPEDTPLYWTVLYEKYPMKYVTGMPVPLRDPRTGRFVKMLNGATPA